MSETRRRVRRPPARPAGADAPPAPPPSPPVVQGPPPPSGATSQAWPAWRTAPEIDVERQRALADRRATPPDGTRGHYPFRGITPALTRADIEWLLTTHDAGRGPVDWSDETQRDRAGLDLRGADLSGLDLSELPLDGMAGALGVLDALTASEEQRQMAAVILRGANLTRARLDGANLAEADLRDAELAGTSLEQTRLWRAHLEGAQLSQVDLRGADIAEVHLEHAHLAGVKLQGADLRAAHLEESRLFTVHLEGASLHGARLDRAFLARAHLEGVDLGTASLIGADLSGASLTGADLRAAHLEGADLRAAHLEGVALDPEALAQVRQGVPDFPATLLPATLQRAFFDAATTLDQAVLGAHAGGFVSVADVRWQGANLTVVTWTTQPPGASRPHQRDVLLGEEREAHQERAPSGALKETGQRIADYELAVRANRQLAIALRQQGLSDDGDRFAYRAQVLEREVLRLRLQVGGYLFSLFLDAVAGYGYRMQRILLTYVLAVTVFALAFFVTGLGGAGPHLALPDAFYISITTFHGRVFAGEVRPGTVQAWISACEAITGLIVEGVFIAMLAQRAFGK